MSLDGNMTTLAESVINTRGDMTTFAESLDKTTEYIPTVELSLNITGDVTTLAESLNYNTEDLTTVVSKVTSVMLQNMTTATSTEMTTQSDLFHKEMLDYFEAESRIIMSPAIFFAGLILPFAIIGNVIALIVYKTRFKESATRSFILTVASFDLLNTCLALPVEIYSMLHSFTFPNAILCKFYVFVEQFSATASAAMLVMFAVHRYRKICTPLKHQMSVTIARSLRLCVFMFSIGITWPAFILYGIQTVATPNPEVEGQRCGIQDYFNESVFSFIYRVVFMIMFCSGAIPITILYIFVARKVLLLKRCKCKTALPYQKVMREMMSTVKLRSLSESSNSSWNKTRVSASSLRYSTNQTKMFSTPKRTTLMIALTTFVYFISFLPNLILRVFEEITPGFVNNMEQPAISFYHIFIRFYYLHCAANPVIYSVLSTKFRHEFRLMALGHKKSSRKFKHVFPSSRY